MNGAYPSTTPSAVPPVESARNFRRLVLRAALRGSFLFVVVAASAGIRAPLRALAEGAPAEASKEAPAAEKPEAKGEEKKEEAKNEEGKKPEEPQGAHAEGAEGRGPDGPRATPVPRYILLPPLLLKQIDGNAASASKDKNDGKDSGASAAAGAGASAGAGAEPTLVTKQVDFTVPRLSLVLLVASWSERSQEIAARLSKAYPDFEPRSILFLGVFSHDTRAGLGASLKKIKPSYPFGLANVSFLEALGNPSVPTLWLVGRRGEILSRWVRPSDDDVKNALAKLRLWTDF